MEEKEVVEEKEILVEENVVKIEQEVEEVESAEETESTEVEETVVEKPTYSESFNKKIEGKTEDELKKMLFESQKYSGKLGTELGELRNYKKDVETPKTSKDIKTRIEKTDVKIANLDAQIRKLDPELDDDEISDLVEKKNYLLEKKAGYNDQHLQMFIKESIEKQGAGEHNKRLSGEVRDEFAKNYDQKFSDEDWEVIDNYAKNVSEDYRVERVDYEYAMMKALGVDKYKALNKSKAEVTVRNDIEQATRKTVATVGGNVKKSYLELDLDNMSDYQLGKFLDKLSDKELARLKEKIKG